jgi:hypothetical protein
MLSRPLFQFGQVARKPPDLCISHGKHIAENCVEKSAILSLASDCPFCDHDIVLFDHPGDGDGGAAYEHSVLYDIVPARRGVRLGGAQLIGYCQRSSAAIWMRLPQLSLNMAMVEPVTLVGGMVKSAPAAFMRSYSRCTSST